MKWKGYIGLLSVLVLLLNGIAVAEASTSSSAAISIYSNYPAENPLLVSYAPYEHYQLELSDPESKSSHEIFNCKKRMTCHSCLKEPSCGWCPSNRVCLPKQNEKAQCSVPLARNECPSFFDKKLFIGTALLFVSSVFTAGGGIGGGGIYIPIFVLILGYSPHIAIPLSKVTIFGVAVGGFLVLMRHRHPKTDRPLIDYDLAFVTEPMILLGTVIGVFMNIAFPTYLLIIFLVLVLGYNAYKTLVKGFWLYKKEKQAADLARLLIQDDDVSGYVEVESVPSVRELRRDSVAQLEFILQKERKSPWWQILVLAVVEAGMLTLMLLKGNFEGSIIGVTCGSWQYWLIVASTIPYLGIVSLFISRYLNKKHEERVAAHYPYLQEDMQWTTRRSYTLPLLFVLAGTAAGFLGIGAGLVVGPIFLELGIYPQVAVATSSYMILYTSFSTVIQFVILGRLPWENAIWYFFVGFFGAIVGQIGLSRVLQKYKKQAIINFMLGTVIALSVVSMATLEGISLYQGIKKHEPMGFNSVCTAE